MGFTDMRERFLQASHESSTDFAVIGCKRFL